MHARDVTSKHINTGKECFQRAHVLHLSIGSIAQHVIIIDGDILGLQLQTRTQVCAFVQSSFFKKKRQQPTGGQTKFGLLSHHTCKYRCSLSFPRKQLVPVQVSFFCHEWGLLPEGVNKFRRVQTSPRKGEGNKLQIRAWRWRARMEEGQFILCDSVCVCDLPGKCKHVW